MSVGIEIRRATHDDYEGVKAFTEDLWEDRGGDYIPEIYHDWLEDDDERKKTFLADAGDEVAGIVQAVMVSDDEAWFQGMRVNPAYQRQGLSGRLNEACFEWAREQGATVGRIMIFSWNAASLGAARTGGFEPRTEFRFAHPEPDPNATGPDHVANDPAAAWRYWTHSGARDHLQGLGFAPEETWAVRELTREDFATFAAESAVFAVSRESGTAGTAYRVRSYDRDGDDGSETWAEYGVGAWDDVDAARSLFGAIARDAAELGADRTRVLIPETAGYVSDASYAGADISEEPDFVLGIDLSTGSREG
ncbi:GNAT family N-acetyltransferase [Natronococcus occultus]|uniref:Acetyltransferase (GNAT) family n=1 Tax=Natronococcus occultus SP4 TaxID=694430 RepID=L0JVZ1_9EURY|nr:GNAT family N-acetyltransferase [Natronococcus occultus]AGB36274.1 Acetyltransferase (GNAT) family [Natronococcus occultus SP4]